MDRVSASISQNHEIKRQRGFTLLELVIVIVLLGVLAAMALPRMIHNYDDAHRASVTATGAALSSAVILARSQWISNGLDQAVDAINGYGADNIASNAQGWPSDAGQGSASKHDSMIRGDAERCVRLWRGLLIEGAPEVATSRLVQPDYLAEAPVGSICRYTYLKNKDNSRIEYNLSAGSVVTRL